MTGFGESAPVARLAQIGHPLPDLALPRLDGELVHMDSLRGRRVVLFFWGSW